MPTLQDYVSQVQALVHDTNGADFTVATLTNFINQARARVALDTHCIRNFLSVTGGNALNTINTQENYTYNGTIGGVTVTNGGSGYVSPTISFTGGGGSGAAASATVVGGVITEINMTSWGINYVTAPTVVITDSTGVGAAANATLLYNIFDILSITVLWGNLRVMFEWMPFTMFQAFARQYVDNFNVPGLFTIHQGEQQVFMYQIPDQAYTMEWDVLKLPNPLVNLPDNDTQIIFPYSDAVQFYAAHLCMASLQNFQMADYWYSGNAQRPGKYDLRVKQLPASLYSRRIFNPYRTFAKRLRRM